MQLAIKLAISVAVILAATGVARKFPSIAGLISVMPLAGALILAFVYYENKGDWQVMQGFTRGAIWGIAPSIVFYLVAFFCLKREMSLAAVLGSSFGAWFIAALVHHFALK